jgi:hypothetical protein
MLFLSHLLVISFFVLLTPKIPCVFLPNYVVVDIVGETIFFKIQSMRS